MVYIVIKILDVNLRETLYGLFKAYCKVAKYGKLRFWEYHPVICWVYPVGNGVVDDKYIMLGNICNTQQHKADTDTGS